MKSRSMKRAFALSAVAVSALVLALTASDAQAQLGYVTLHDQLEVRQGLPSIISQDFTDAVWNSRDSAAAEDFFVPEGEVWQIDRVQIYGSYEIPAFGCSPAVVGPAASFEVSIYGSNLGLPGAAPIQTWSGLAAPATGGHRVGVIGTFDLSPPLVLGPGPVFPEPRYWVSVRSEQNCTATGTWIWASELAGAGGAGDGAGSLEGVWRNPANGYESGCVDWTSMSDCSAVPAGYDLSFSLFAATCGNGSEEHGEECDDGNVADGDGCSESCQTERTWDCSETFPSVCENLCGNGEFDEYDPEDFPSSESCDDGNTSNGDGCSSECTFESGWECDGGFPTFCHPHSECPDTIAELPTCRTAGVSKLIVKDHPTKGDSKDAVIWSWSRGDETLAFEDILDPTSDVAPYEYVFCAYSVGLGSRFEFDVRAVSDDFPRGLNWERVGSSSPKGYKFKDKRPGNDSPDGAQQVEIRVGEAGRSKIKFKAGGDQLEDFEVPLLPFEQTIFVALIDAPVPYSPVHDPTECWSSTFGPADIKKSTDAILKAVSK